MYIFLNGELEWMDMLFPEYSRVHDVKTYFKEDYGLEVKDIRIWWIPMSKSNRSSSCGQAVGVWPTNGIVI